MSGGPSYGIKCEPETLPLLNVSEFFQYPESEPIDNQSKSQLRQDDTEVPHDMDLNGLFDMDDKNLSELTGGMNVSEWNSLFNGQLDGIDSLDPMTGIQSTATGAHGEQMGVANMAAQHPGSNNNGMDSWLLHETQRLERQQKIQQQKLLELQQTLLKTEILKNQIQIANISQSQPSGNSPPPLLTTEVAGGSYSFSPALSGVPRASGNVEAHSPRVSSLVIGNQSLGSPANSVGSGAMPSPRIPAIGSAQPHIDTKPVVIPNPPDSPTMAGVPPEGDKRKVHNLIEKKYRCSINDRIIILRDKVSKNCKESKRLQKSAVLQKTIDFIEHLERTISRLEEENRKLRDALNAKPRMPSFTSPPATPHTLISPKSLDSEDSGHSSADDYLSDEMSRETSPQNANRTSNVAFLATHLMQGTTQSVPQYLMVVMLVAIFFVNPFSLMSGSSPQYYSAGGARTLSSYDDPQDSLTISWGLWLFRAVCVLLCFGWAVLKAVPKHLPSSQEALSFWRLKNQADDDINNGEFTRAYEHLESALAAIGRPLPSSYFGLVAGLIWNTIVHCWFQVLLGQWAVSIVSTLGCEVGSAEHKKGSPPITASSLSRVYHLLHQINMSSTSQADQPGVSWYLALNALNFAESGRPNGDITSAQLAQLYFTLGLQFQSTPTGWPFKRYYYHLFRSLTRERSFSPLKWAWSDQGNAYLLSGEWMSEVKLGTRLFKGEAAFPIHSVSRGFCKTLLCDTLNALLLTESSPSQSVVDCALDTFKHVLGLSKHLSSCLLSQNEGKQLSTLSNPLNSGYTSVQWWSAVGIVACYRLSGQESKAEEYYHTIEGESGDGSSVPSTIQFALKTVLAHKKQEPVDVVVHLFSMTSNSFSSAVSELLHDNFSSTENQLYRVGMLLAADWLLSTRVSLWECRGKESLSKDIRLGFYQDLETMGKLVGLLPAGLSRLRMYKGYYQLLAGGNPMTARALLGSTKLRRRVNGKDLPVECLGPSSTQLPSSKEISPVSV